MKAITTHFVGPTSTRPARYVARDLDANRIELTGEEAEKRASARAVADSRPPFANLSDYRDALHYEAAAELCAVMGWPGAERLAGGAILGGMAWIFIPERWNR